MSKKIKVKYDTILTFDSLYRAFYRSRSERSRRREVVNFEQNLEINLINIYDELYNLTYKVSEYKSFTIFEPKERLIKTLPLKDRVIHQWYVEEFLKPYMVPKFIHDTYACIEGKGTHEAYRRVLKYMRIMRKLYGEYYIIKMDIKKYFFNVNRSILNEIMFKNFKDKKFLELTKIIIGDLRETGLPIGNYTSQYFANIYLSLLDYYIKFDLKIKYYCRYMDDFVLLVKDKEEAAYVFKKIEEFLKEKLCLELNKKSNYYPSKYGCNFCGYIIYEDFILLRKRNKINFVKKIKFWNYLYDNNRFNVKKFEQSMASFKGSLSHADCYKFINKCFCKIKFIKK